MNQDIGYLAHEYGGCWLIGPLPSSKCVEALVQRFIFSEADSVVDEKWRKLENGESLLKRDQYRRNRVKWAIQFKGMQISDAVKQSLDYALELGAQSFLVPGQWEGQG